MDQRRTFSREFKLAAVKKIIEQGMSYTQVASEHFSAGDINRDASLSLNEYKLGLQGESDHQKRFNRFDVNSDGKLTADEFK